jgi:hypothetical protein
MKNKKTRTLKNQKVQKRNEKMSFQEKIIQF